MRRFYPILLILICACTALAAANWHYPLYLASDGFWEKRIPIEIENNMDRAAAGEPVAIEIGDAAGQAHLVGHHPEAIRLCTEDGTGLLYNITGPYGAEINSGPIPDGGTLTIPAECRAHGTATQYVYFDNSHAWQVPKFLQAFLEVRNGGMEAAGSGDAPKGWHHDTGDAEHKAMGVSENPHSGDKCLKTVVSEGAEPTWIATRQRNIRLIGGAKYRMTAWVKAKNATGSVGWYIHVGTKDDPMMIESVPDDLLGGPGTYDWKKVSWEFKAPDKANIASLGTVLRGTSTAWFDDVSLELLDDIKLSASAGEVQTLEIRHLGQNASWYDGASDDGIRWQHRVPVQVVNTSDSPISEPLLVVDTSTIAARMRGQLNEDSLRLTYNGRAIAYYHAGDSLFFADTIPPETIKTYYLYFSDNPDIQPTKQSGYAELLRSDRNLVQNPSFERGEQLPEHWPGGTEGQRHANADMSIVENGRFGDRAVRIHVPDDSKPAWTGWRQHVPVKPNKQYLYAAWVRTRNIKPDARIHGHFRNADGDLCQSKQYTGGGPTIQRTNDWTMLSGIIEMPPDIATFQAHLTMNATGTMWHDGVLVAEAVKADTGSMESKMQPALAQPTAWPVNAIVKVFRNDLPPKNPKTARISAARNEKEPLQVAIRSPKALDNVRVDVTPPQNDAGRALDDVTVNIVGYVPIDHKTSYYSSESPTWHRKYPTSPGRCDGWQGMWPDPLLPNSSFNLKANSTQPVWITVSVPKDAPAGDYQGAVQFQYGNDQLRLPFNLHVWDFTLPDESHVKAIYDLRLNDKWWNVPDQSKQQTRRRFGRFMAKRRVSPHRIYPAPSFSNDDGNLTADFSQFDEAAEYYFDELKLPHAYTPWQFSCFGWGHPPRKMLGEKPYEGEYPYENADRSNLRDEYKTVYQSALRKFWNHITEKGWEDKFKLYISDEPWDHRRDYIITQMRALCDMIHEVDPDIRIYSSTWHHQPKWNGYIDVWGFGHYGRVTTETIRERRAAGDTIWWTTDGQMCTDTPYCAIERLLPYYCFEYGAKAYEFWGIDWLTYNPHEFGWHSYIHQSGEPGESHWVRYPNGDGFLAYPGSPVGHDGPLSSLRLEQAREGVEDYEYLYMLRQRIRKAKKAGADVESQQAALEFAMQLVERPCPVGRYSTKILPEPHKVFAVKKQLAGAIQTLD